MRVTIIGTGNMARGIGTSVHVPVQGSLGGGSSSEIEPVS